MFYRHAELKSLRHNPFNIFQENRTPVCLYARKKWLGLENTLQWKSDYQKTVSELFRGQCDNGSWNNSLVLTVHRLFGLHLTVRNINSRIEKAFTWLLATDSFITFDHFFKSKKSKISSKNLHNIPFTHGCSEHFSKGAILFLATIFGKDEDERVLSMYEKLRILGEKRNGKWCDWSCSNHIFRAFAVHPGFGLSRATRMAVGRLSDVQGENGTWTRQIPFYQTVNALAHVGFKNADSQLRRAFQTLVTMQQRDGTWGKRHKEWKTFLILHAMKRKNHLLPMESIKDAP